MAYHTGKKAIQWSCIAWQHVEVMVSRLQ